MIKQGFYRHFKGSIYEVIGVGKHSETLEKHVIYRSIETGVIWIRPAEMFDDQITRDGYDGPRFAFISDTWR